MCELCVKEQYPDRETICLEKGSYLINFRKCSSCGDHNMKVLNLESSEPDEEELITYDHVCDSCEHVVAQHEYVFKVEGEYQLYEMSCLLCGTAEDQRSIMPVDPRGPAML